MQINSLTIVQGDFYKVLCKKASGLKLGVCILKSGEGEIWTNINRAKRLIDIWGVSPQTESSVAKVHSEKRETRVHEKGFLYGGPNFAINTVLNL